MNSKKKAAAIKKQEDTALTRALVWFAAAMVLEFLVLLLNNVFTRGVPSWAFANALAKALPIVAVGCLAVAVAAGIWCRKRSALHKGLAFMPLVLSAVFLMLAVSAVLLFISLSALDLLKVVIPALGVLALVYYLYQRDFFLSALCSGLSLLGVWWVSRGGGKFSAILYPCFAAGALVLVVVAVLVLKLKKDGGVVKCRGKRILLLSKQTNYGLLLVTCALSALTLLAVSVLGILGLLAVIAAGLAASVAHYLVFVLLGWLFIQLVYYTVKMM